MHVDIFIHFPHNISRQKIMLKKLIIVHTLASFFILYLTSKTV
jgi:hypothetical protein